jgi:hypothetical protein
MPGLCSGLGFKVSLARAGSPGGSALPLKPSNDTRSVSLQTGLIFPSTLSDG